MFFQIFTQDLQPTLKIVELQVSKHDEFQCVQAIDVSYLLDLEQTVQK